MFRSDEGFTSLDNLFHIDKPNHLWSRDELEKRTEEINGVYHEWHYDLWLFSSDNEERNRFQDYAYTAMETLRYASLCHIMGFFQASVLLSSIATERLLHCILLLSDAVRKEALPRGTPIIRVNTVTGNEDYAQIPGVGLEAVSYENGIPYYLRLPSLGKKPLTAVEKLGYPSRELLDSNESLDNCVFVARRHAMAHARFERTDLIEQSHSSLTHATPNPYPMFDQSSSLDQYQKASSFIAGTFERFGTKYGSSIKKLE